MLDLAEPAVASRHPLALLNDPGTVRARCAAVVHSIEQGVSANFTIDRNALPAVAARVVALMRRRFPDLKIPYHSRWRHFEAGGVDRKAEMDALLQGQSVAEQARARFDLTTVSVLLDAGAGAAWRYTEQRTLDASALPHAAADDLLAALDRVAAGTAAPAPAPAAAGVSYNRSEGLGVASFRAFMAGAFSSQRGMPLQADAAALRHVDAAALRAIFQSSPSNPMVGLDGRAQLLSRLGQVLAADKVRTQSARPGDMFDRLSTAADGSPRTSVGAAEVLAEVLRLLAPVWPSGSKVQGLPAGDVWPHRWAGSSVAGGGLDRTTDGWVPFHKLSQWLAYSLLEPLQWAGVQVTGLDALTGLPEYRNGGLFIDGGVVLPRNPRALSRTWKPQDEFVVEWRALTVVLLDELALLVRQQLGLTAEQLPLVCVLEGGTWAAGREIALELRSDGAPPVKIESDGTVF